MVQILKKIFWILLTIFIGIMIIGYIFSAIQHQIYLSRVERVNVIRLQGPIEESIPDFMSGQNINPGTVSQKLDQAARDDSIKAVVLRVNSPGGSVAASQEIADIIKDFEKPLIVSMGDMAASGGYYISAPADGIIAQPGTMTGSIGVIMSTVNPEELLDKIGIEMEIIKSGEHKDLFQRGLTDEERQILQQISDEAYNQFITEISDGRDLDFEDVKKLATGEIYTGSQAAELGLVDRLGGIEEAVDYASKLAELEDPVKYEQPAPGLFEQLWGTAYQIPNIIRNNWLADELLIWQNFKSEPPYRLRYEIR